MRKLWLAAAMAAAMAAAGTAGPAAAVDPEGFSLQVQPDGEFGPHLVDAEGRPVFLFTGDRQGSADAPAQSRCRNACAEALLPVTVPGGAELGTVARPEMLDTIDTADGSRHVTYNGWPLYYRIGGGEDPAAPPQKPQRLGGEWHLVSPDGLKAGEQRAEAARGAAAA